MDQLICASLSHTTYDVGMLQVMAEVAYQEGDALSRIRILILYAGEVSNQPKISRCVSSQTRIENFQLVDARDLDQLLIKG